jgi:hypothetical protein
MQKTHFSPDVELSLTGKAQLRHLQGQKQLKPIWIAVWSNHVIYGVLFLEKKVVTYSKQVTSFVALKVLPKG